MIVWRCDTRGALHQLQNYQKRSSYTHCIFKPAPGGSDPFYKLVSQHVLKLSETGGFGTKRHRRRYLCEHELFFRSNPCTSSVTIQRQRGQLLKGMRLHWTCLGPGTSPAWGTPYFHRCVVYQFYVRINVFKISILNNIMLANRILYLLVGSCTRVLSILCYIEYYSTGDLFTKLIKCYLRSRFASSQYQGSRPPMATFEHASGGVFRSRLLLPAL